SSAPQARRTNSARSRVASPRACATMVVTCSWMFLPFSIGRHHASAGRQRVIWLRTFRRDTNNGNRLNRGTNPEEENGNEAQDQQEGGQEEGRQEEGCR